MPKIIIDEFTEFNVTPMRKLQLRRIRDGFCAYCRSAPVEGKTTCQKHRDSANKRSKASNNRTGRIKAYPQVAKMLKRKDRLGYEQIGTICGVSVGIVYLVAKELGITKPGKIYHDRSTSLIMDEFTTLPVSREMKRRLRKMKRGLCLRCKSPAREGKQTCSGCADKAKTRWRQKKAKSRKKK